MNKMRMETTGTPHIDSPYIPGKNLLEETIYLGAIVLVGILACTFGLLTLFMPLTRAIVVTVRIVPAALVPATLITVSVAFYRVTRFERMERRMLREHDLRLEMAQLEIERMYALESGHADSAHDAGVRMAQWWDTLARTIVRRYYAHLRTEGEKGARRLVSRRYMTERGECTQPQWNTANRMLVAAGIRDDQGRFIPATLADAEGMWEAYVRSIRSWRRYGDELVPSVGPPYPTEQV